MTETDQTLGDGTDPLAARRKRLKYRSTYTGTKETDVLLGAFADRHLDSLTEAQLDAYDALLSVPDPRLYKWITGQEEAPAEHRSSVLDLLRAFKLSD